MPRLEFKERYKLWDTFFVMVVLFTKCFRKKFFFVVYSYNEQDKYDNEYDAKPTFS